MLLAGIQPESADQPLQKLDDTALETLVIVLDFLKSFRAGAYEDCRKYKHQKSDEFWANLVAIFNTRNLPEQKILNEHYKLVRKAWRKRYRTARGKNRVKDKHPVKDRDPGIPS